MSVADPNPLLRPEVYSFSTSSTTVEAAAKLPIPGGFGRQIIYNSAYDVVTGYKMRAVEPSLTIKKNLATSPLVLIDAIANKTNEWPWAGGAGLTWLCTAISGEQKTEVVGTEVITYWAVSANFSYRSQKWNLRIKDIGLNERVPREGGGFIKRRCRVYDQNGNFVAATTAQPLNPDGTQRDSETISELEYTIYEWADFSNYFIGPT
jgi:hypothetical protein